MSNLLYILLLISVSGVIQNVSGNGFRLVGASKAPWHYGRFHTSLQNLTGHHVCGGAVISPRHVLTAAHCVQGAAPEYIKIVVGTTDLDLGGLKYGVSSIKIHHDFNFNDRINDIAVLESDGEFDLRFVEVLKMEEKELVDGDEVILTGFGAQEPNGQPTRHMYALKVKVFNQETCQFAMRYTRQVTEQMFCTFTHIGEGTCHGDSGGPLIKDNKIVGIVSWGIPCAAGFPDVHTRISSLLPWLNSVIKYGNNWASI